MDNPTYSTRTVVIVSVIVLLAIIGGTKLLFSTRPEAVKITVNPPLPTATSEPTATPEPITVYVTGAVTNPQTTVELPYGSRVQDALDAVGGVMENADLERINVAGILHDGDQVHVFAIGETVAPGDAVLATPSGGIVVHINTATLEELQTLPDIGPALAQRIIDYREANGSFADWDALDAVEGIGPVMLENLRDLVAFD